MTLCSYYLPGADISLRPNARRRSKRKSFGTSTFHTYFPFAPTLLLPLPDLLLPAFECRVVSLPTRNFEPSSIRPLSLHSLPFSNPLTDDDVP